MSCMSNERVGKSQSSQNFTEAPARTFCFPNPPEAAQIGNGKRVTPTERSFHPNAQPGSIKISCDRAQPVYNSVFIFNRANWWLKTESGPTSSRKFKPQITSLELLCSS